MALRDLIRQRVVQFRVDKRITQKDFSKIFGMGAENYRRYERGEIDFTFEMLAAICDLYKLDDDYFISNQEKPRNLTIDEEVERRMQEALPHNMANIAATQLNKALLEQMKDDPAISAAVVTGNIKIVPHPAKDKEEISATLNLHPSKG